MLRLISRDAIADDGTDPRCNLPVTEIADNTVHPVPSRAFRRQCVEICGTGFSQPTRIRYTGSRQHFTPARRDFILRFSAAAGESRFRRFTRSSASLLAPGTPVLPPCGNAAMTGTVADALGRCANHIDDAAKCSLSHDFRSPQFYAAFLLLLRAYVAIQPRIAALVLRWLCSLFADIIDDWIVGIAFFRRYVGMPRADYAATAGIIFIEDRFPRRLLLMLLTSLCVQIPLASLPHDVAACTDAGEFARCWSGHARQIIAPMMRWHTCCC